MKLEDSIGYGRFVIAGNAVQTSELARLLGDLTSDENTTNSFG
jgi:hypothetical protein